MANLLSPFRVIGLWSSIWLPCCHSHTAKLRAGPSADQVQRCGNEKQPLNFFSDQNVLTFLNLCANSLAGGGGCSVNRNGGLWIRLTNQTQIRLWGMFHWRAKTLPCGLSFLSFPTFLCKVFFSRACGHAALTQAKTWQTSFWNCLPSLCVQNPSAETSGFFFFSRPHEQSDLRNVWHVFHLTLASFLLAFPNWTEWSRCHSQPIPSPGLAFHYSFPDCSGVQDKLVMSKVKLFPGHCESAHLLKRGGVNRQEGMSRDLALAKRWLYLER